MRISLVLVLLATALALPGTALASPQYEPNDSLWQAYGPLAASTDYHGTIISEDDVDWYVLYVSGQGSLNLEITATDWPPEAVDAWDSTTLTLRDQDGKELNSKSVGKGAGYPQTVVLPYTTPGPGKYYLQVRGSRVGNKYKLRATGPLTVGPTWGTAEITPNASRTRSSAFGPLAGGKLYAGSIDSHDEQDWFYFYTAGPGAFDVSLTTTGLGGANSSSSTGMVMYDGDDKELTTTSAGTDEIGHIRYTAAGPSYFALRVSGRTGLQYQFRIDPASLVTSTPPPVVPQAVKPKPKPKSKTRPKKRKRLSVPVKRNRAIFTVSCPTGRPCRGRVTVTGKVGRRTVALAKGRYKVAAGKSKRVVLRVTKRGRKLLKRRANIRGKAVVVNTANRKRKRVAIVLRRR